MDELYFEWQELVEAGECDEEFEDWFSGKVDDAWDQAKQERDE